ncbi:MAG: M24 family metallopeptidase [Acutalibacteraceae bacterium]
MSRLKTLMQLLPDGADAALLISNENRRYFTDFVSSLGYLLVTKVEAYLLVDSRYAEAAQKQAKDCVVKPFAKLSDSVHEIVKMHDIKDILLEGSAFTINDAKKMEELFGECGVTVQKTSELNRIVERMRVVKSADEIEKMTKAQRLTEEAFEDTLNHLAVGMTERDVALDLEYRMRKLGADGVSFDLITISGAKTSMPHGVPDNKKIEKGDFVLFDIGATFEGYHSDMTRTVAMGNISDKQKFVYQVVLDAQMRGLQKVKAGITCGDVDNACRSYIYQAGFEGKFGHSTGHGVGLEIHEKPTISPENEKVLKSGMVITVEPGIYLPEEFGVRIEDMVVVTEDGCINLTNSPKELRIL